MIRPIPPGPLSPATAQRLTELLARLDNPVRMRATAPLAVVQRDGIPIISSNIPPRIIAVLTGHEPFGEYDSAFPDAPPGYNPDSGDQYDLYPDCKYSWYEARVNKDSCGYEAIPGGRRGWVDKFPMVPINGDDTLEDGTIVEAWLAPDGDHWRFQPGTPGGEGLTVAIPDCITLLVEDTGGSGGDIKADFVDDATSGEVTETDLYSADVTFPADNDKIVAEYAGTGVNGENVTFRVYLDGNLYFDSTAITLTDDRSWLLRVIIIRVSSTTTRSVASLHIDVDAPAIVQYHTQTGLDLTTSVPLKLTGESSASSAIVGKFGYVELKPHAPMA